MEYVAYVMKPLGKFPEVSYPGYSMFVVIWDYFCKFAGPVILIKPSTLVDVQIPLLSLT